jgi:hypothetical protein
MFVHAFLATPDERSVVAAFSISFNVIVSVDDMTNSTTYML